MAVQLAIGLNEGPFRAQFAKQCTRKLFTEYTVDITDYLYTGNDNLDGDYTVNGLNQYTDVDGESYDYDDKGNLTDIGTDDYSYDSLNRMTSALGVSLKYDPYGRLYEIDTGSAVTRFVYDGDAMVLELDGNNAIQGRYVHGPGVDQPLVWYDGSSVGTTERRHLAADRQGSIIAVSTSTTSAPHINSYDVFGIPDAGNLGRFSYTGQIWLPEIGLMYYKARIYNPQLGRFMQTDPIGYDDQMNLYAYVGNDPMNAVDPTGMYGRGDGFSDDEWEKFDASQQQTADDLFIASSNLLLTVSDMEDGELSATSQAIIGEFERVMGEGSGTAENMTQVAAALYHNATALTDDGTLGYTANVMTTAQMDASYPLSAPHTYVAAGVPRGTKTMNLNRDHSLFNSGASTGYVLAHEPNHNFGRRDERFRGATAFSKGTSAQRSAYRNMPMAQRLKNADHIARLTHR